MLLAASVPSLSWQEALLRLALAAALGAAVGLERELREREAGLRTHLLVSLGSALFTIASAYGFRDFLVEGGALVRTDPTRIAAQIVTGIGFLGAGAIIRQGLSVRGLTTAATLWVVAAIGLTTGAGYYSAAVITTALVLISLWPLRILAFRTMRRFRPETERLLAQLPAGESPSPLIERLEALGGSLQSLEVGHEADRRTVLIDVTLPPKADPPAIVADLSELEHVLEIRWSD
jgi:putative Mg2+ transporter-C (MgtC) family protein